MSRNEEFSRREMIAGLGSAAAVAAGPSHPHGAKPLNDGSSIPLQDPVTKYPHPPFKRQSQPWPGLVSKMEPRPDHGEETYRGSGRLRGRKALITGGDSGMRRAA